MGALRYLISSMFLGASAGLFHGIVSTPSDIPTVQKMTYIAPQVQAGAILGPWTPVIVTGILIKTTQESDYLMKHLKDTKCSGLRDIDKQLH